MFTSRTFGFRFSRLLDVGMLYMRNYARNVQNLSALNAVDAGRVADLSQSCRTVCQQRGEWKYFYLWHESFLFSERLKADLYAVLHLYLLDFCLKDM